MRHHTITYTTIPFLRNLLKRKITCTAPLCAQFELLWAEFETNSGVPVSFVLVNLLQTI